MRGKAGGLINAVICGKEHLSFNKEKHALKWLRTKSFKPDIPPKYAIRDDISPPLFHGDSLQAPVWPCSGQSL